MTAPHRVLVIGPAPPGSRSRGGMATVIGHMRDHPDTRLRIRVVPTYVDAGTVERLRVGLTGMATAVWLVLAGRVDVLHVHLSHGGSVIRKSPALWAARLRGVPAVIHGHSFDFGGWMGRLPAPVRRLVRVALPADRWLVLGAGLAAEYRAALGLPEGVVEVLYNPVVLPDAVSGADDRPGDVVEVVALGRLGHRKGSYDLVRAVAGLPADVAGRVHLTLAGDGEVDEVRAAVRTAGLDGAVTVRDWVDAAERDRLLARADVFTLPSYDEGLPMALLEAMGAGLVPISTPIGGIPEAITDGVDGLLVEPGDAPAIAAALTGLVHDRARAAELAEAARRRSEDF
ncbi:glycosyltransferase family 4 protein, partial [Tsukamurella tyrosinosolvens]|uniref:glycosyltransferase family 4 protein n=2 Tax=Tsukamurellaceae TaxID=85028 RepID=UPI0021637B07